MPALKNPKHELVALHYFGDPERIGWKAYKKVYPKSSKHACETAFSRMLKTAEFKKRIDGLMAAAAERSVVTKARVLQELARLGFANMLDYVGVDSEGQPFIDLSALDRDKAAAIQEVRVERRTETISDGDDEREVPVHTVRFKLADKRAALVDIGRELGMFKTKVEHEVSGKNGNPIETKDVTELTPLEKARRVAFLLSSATIAGQTVSAQKAAKAAPPAPAETPKKPKPNKEKA